MWKQLRSIAFPWQSVTKWWCVWGRRMRFSDSSSGSIIMCSVDTIKHLELCIWTESRERVVVLYLTHVYIKGMTTAYPNMTVQITCATFFMTEVWHHFVVIMVSLTLFHFTVWLLYFSFCGQTAAPVYPHSCRVSLNDCLLPSFNLLSLSWTEGQRLPHPSSYTKIL